MHRLEGSPGLTVGDPSQADPGDDTRVGRSRFADGEQSSNSLTGS